MGSNAGFIVKYVVGTIKHFKIANIYHFLHILDQVMPAVFLEKKHFLHQGYKYRVSKE